MPDNSAPTESPIETSSETGSAGKSRFTHLLWLPVATIALALLSTIAWLDAQGEMPRQASANQHTDRLCLAPNNSGGHEQNQVQIPANLDNNNSHNGFGIDRYEVTNAQFAEFVAATAYLTIAEQDPDPLDFPGVDPELLVPGSAVFIAPELVTSNDITQWWKFVAGANWQQPLGPDSNVAGLENHPVVHIAYDDAIAYAEWAGRALPTEAQWQSAALSGESKHRQIWHETPDGNVAGNIWNGLFPVRNTATDGFAALAPVGCYEPSQAGLHDMIGNVWEWVEDSYSEKKARYPTLSGADSTFSAQTSNSATRVEARTIAGTIKGGSFLCAENFCMNYRPQARLPQDRSLGTNHLGFRTVSITPE